jgi:hypothetical protein
VEKLDDNYLRLPYKERYLKFNVPEGNTPVKITLSWSDFSDSFYEYATNQDLDLILEEKNGKVLSDAGYIQDGKDHGTEYGYSRHAREKIDATLQKGEYRLKVKAKSKLDSQLHFWIAVSGPGVTVEGSNGRDKVLIPADNPEVLAIGAYDVDYCNMQLDAAGKKIFKPDMVTSSVIQFEDGMVVHGSSTASAIAAGTLAVYASSLPGRQVTRAQLLEQIASRKIVADTPELIGMFGTRFDPSKVILPPVLKLPKP